jgi:cytochrome oxidase assembly protein ShyY1
VSVALARTRERQGAFLPGVCALIAFVAFIALGTWQLDRKTWKEALIATLDRRLAAEPTPVPPPREWNSLNADKDEFRRVAATVSFAPDDEALVYTIGSAFRPDVSGPGYWVFAPAKLDNGARVVVNRGFVPEGERAQASHRPLAGRVRVIGVMRWPEQRAWFTPEPNPSRNTWFARDHLAIANAKGWGDLAPFFVELETPTAEGDLPHAGPLTVKLRNDHLQYAITWYGLAAVVAFGFAFWLRSRRGQPVG